VGEAQTAPAHSLERICARDGHRWPGFCSCGVIASPARTRRPIAHGAIHVARDGIEVWNSYAERILNPRRIWSSSANALSRGTQRSSAVPGRADSLHLDAALLHEEFLKGRESLVVAGTHADDDHQHAGRGSIRSPRAKPHAGAFIFSSAGVAETRHELPTPPPAPSREGDEYDTASSKGTEVLHTSPDGADSDPRGVDHADIYADLKR